MKRNIQYISRVNPAFSVHMYCFFRSSQVVMLMFLPSWPLCVQRKLPSPGFQVEVVLVDYNGAAPSGAQTESAVNRPVQSSGTSPASTDGAVATTATGAATNPVKDSGSNEKDDDVFSDGEAEETGSSKSRQAKAASESGGTVKTTTSGSEIHTKSDQAASLTHDAEQLSLGRTSSTHTTNEPKKDAIGGAGSGLNDSNPVGESEFKVMAADASVFSFGDDEDYESD